MLEKFQDMRNKITILKYKSKYQKFNISYSLIEYLIERLDIRDCSDILKIIETSKNINEFRQNIINYLKKNPNNRYRIILLVGNITGVYNYYSCKSANNTVNNIDNFNTSNKERVISQLRTHFYDYVMNNNIIKNQFYRVDKIYYYYMEEINEEEIKDFFDRAILGNVRDNENIKAGLVYDYIYNVVSNYSLDDILNNMDFVNYDMQIDSKKTLAEKREEFNNHKNIGIDVLIKINNLEALKNKLIIIDSTESKALLNRLNNISNPYDSVEEINDIYLDYEYLIRKDILDHLYIPEDKEIVVEDFRNVRPQLIHRFVRNSEKFRDAHAELIKNKIISSRNNSNTSSELTEEEKKQYESLLYRLDAEFDQVKVNYSYESGHETYSDANGWYKYFSDTSNQISASVYSSDYFNDKGSSMIGIGFNSDSIVPESIVLSSCYYLTTNKGLNNIEYDSRKEFQYTSATYSELIKNDGYNEVVLFRRGIDFDSKAAYVFVAFDSTDRNYNELIEQGRKFANQNHLKLVLYDLVKIKQSYQDYINNNRNEKKL